MINIEVNGKQVSAEKEDTILTALRREGIKVPTLCHIDGLNPTGACRMCVVEVEGYPGLIPSCSYPVNDGMKIFPNSQRVVNARKTILELLLANHPDDCLYCVRNSNCELRLMAAELNVDYRRYFGKPNKYKKDTSSPSISRDPAKCILCGKCVRVCEEIQGVSAIDFINRGSKAIIGTAFNQGLNVSSCINCGQCIMVCPTGALVETSAINPVLQAIANPDLHVVVQHAPSVSVTLGEEFNLPVGDDVEGKMTNALRKIGFDKVFETAFSADLTVMEEASEFVYRLKNNGTLPMMTSCSPGWIKYVEQFYPEFIPNLSSCKSPQQMLGAVIKSYYSEANNIPQDKIYSVAIMPCTAKKFEADREEMSYNGIQDIDAVLTTRELATMIKMKGIEFTNLTSDKADSPFGEQSGAGKIFGTSGGVMEAALRTAYKLITNTELQQLDINEVRGMKELKILKINIDGQEFGFAVVNGLGNAKKLLEEIKNGRNDIHFIEVMTCPGGCIAGGGQPLHTNKANVIERMKALYTIDKEVKIRKAHDNPSVCYLYESYLGEPLGHKSHELLHTKYSERKVLK